MKKILLLLTIAISLLLLTTTVSADTHREHCDFLGKYIWSGIYKDKLEGETAEKNHGGYQLPPGTYPEDNINNIHAAIDRAYARDYDSTDEFVQAEMERCYNATDEMRVVLEWTPRCLAPEEYVEGYECVDGEVREKTPETMQDVCAAMESVDERIMTNRQAGVSMSQVLAMLNEGADKGANKLFTAKVIRAYEVPRYGTEGFVHKAIQDFVNDEALRCYKVAAG